MKKILLGASILLANLQYAQNVTQLNNYIPDILPSSPTTSSLMKFEEIPVDNYTGVADISIPVININIKNNLNLNLQLKYHSGSIAVDEKASDVGLGWNLMAGGTITRTVKGIPDEYKFDGDKRRRGIYRKDEINFPNRYNQVLDILKSGNLGYDNLQNFDKYNEFAWESFFKNTYDTEYDMYQYNFLGNIGRFIVKRSEAGEFIVRKLDDNNLKIKITNNLNFEPEKFVITDDTGYIYTFDVVEKSYSNNVIFSSGYGNSGSSSITKTIDYNSAFHLSSIKDANDVNLAVFTYETPSKEIVLLHNQTNYSFIGSTGFLDIIRAKECENQVFPQLNPTDQTSTNQIISYTRKIKEIDVINKALVKFEFETGRSDTNLHNPSESRFLKKIIVSNATSQKTNTFVLHQNYRESIFNRMFLSKVDVLDKNDDFLYDYQLTYKNLPLATNMQSLGKDLYGYLNLRPEYFFEGYYRNITPSVTNVDILEKIKLPTSGTINFSYENNTYSYNSAYVNTTENITNYDENINNWDEQSTSLIFNKTDKDLGTKKQVFTLDSPTQVYFFIQNNFQENNPSDWRYTLYRNITGTSSAIILTQYTGIEDPDQISKQSVFLEPGQYTLQLSSVDLNFKKPFTSNVKIFYKTKNQRQKYLMAGGLRIKKISHNEGDQNLRDIEYNYQNLNDANLSSGALLIPKPIYEYREINNRKNIRCLEFSYNGGVRNFYDFEFPEYHVITSSNIVPSQRSKGDVGYKYVKIRENGKGSQEFTYSSPIDIPSDYDFTNNPPLLFRETPDYKRGLLKSLNIINEQGSLVKNTVNTYTYTDTLENTGITYYRSNLPLSIYYSRFDKYSDFLNHIRGCAQNDFPIHTNTQSYVGYKEYFYENNNVLPPLCAFYSGETSGIIRYQIENEIIGKANLSKQENNDIFLGKTVKTITDTEFNILNYPLKQKTISADGEVIEAAYGYAHEKNNPYLIGKNIVGIPLETTITKTKDGITKTLSKAENLYPISQAEADTKTSGFALPYQINSTDFLNTTIAEVTYDRYDSKGNIQQYTTKDGISTTIIWGYNGIHPIAKIVGVKLSSITPSLIETIVNASNTDASAVLNNDEILFLSDLDMFRKEVEALSRANAQVTTYTYDPLIGVRSITPSSGIREIYKYDSANRLENIRDINGKLLKEFKYNYKH
ncbi:MULTISPECIES: hypothetical protein [Chryseobacterium]|uniref:hypothetical protein n=1 Tax=Chryseobacterium TaxID=59732 RepID=UPI00195A6356|nr:MULTISPECIES: hypothetical protein [Chryseobacterium]MBM7419398.1 hypothetical protein [Chryseobacterium sp. JUb44]MDH6209323.1 hypothetical protein [Chryseobacterium sp. BIGb0186]WSO12163.1 hypothetical protein VUJ64_09665 [Chryseobacterium scophthalmum]